MDPYAVNMMSVTYVAIHIFWLDANMVAHMEDPYSEFYSVTVHTPKLLCSLPTVAPWVEVRTRYDDFVMTRAWEQDEPIFQLQGA